MTIVVGNQKGGVGKSVITCSLAEYAWEQGLRVLVVDVDGQGNTTRYFLPDRAAEGEGASGLYVDGPTPRPVQVRERLSVLAADVALDDVDALPADDEEVVRRPRQHLATLASEFDVIFVDTPPTRSRRLTGALVAGDAVVTPIGVDRASAEGLEDLLSDLRAIRKGFNAGLRHLGILVNRYRSVNATQRRNLAELRASFGHHVIEGELEDRSPVGAAFDDRRPVWRRADGESARIAGRQFRATCGAVLRRAGL